MPAPPPARGPLFAFHVTLNIWAYAAFALSFVLSLVYLVQDRVLRSHRPGAAFWRFPALDVLDRMARSSVYVGLARPGVRRRDRPRVGASPDGHLRVGRSESDRHAGDSRRLRRLLAAFAQRAAGAAPAQRSSAR